MKSLNNARKLPYFAATQEETKLFASLVLSKHVTDGKFERTLEK